jgi:ketosteroid isomerase-like protein
MTRLCLAALLILAWPAGAAQALVTRGGTPEDHAALKGIADAWFAAYARGDAAAVANIYDENARIMSENDASSVGGAKLRERLEQGFENNVTAFASELEEIEVQGRGAGAWAYIVGLYAARSTPKAGGATKVYGGRFFILLRNTPQGWKVWRDIDNATPDAAALIAKLKAEAGAVSP